MPGIGPRTTAAVGGIRGVALSQGGEFANPPSVVNNPIRRDIELSLQSGDSTCGSSKGQMREASTSPKQPMLRAKSKHSLSAKLSRKQPMLRAKPKHNLSVKLLCTEPGKFTRTVGVKIKRSMTSLERVMLETMDDESLHCQLHHLAFGEARRY